MMSPDKIPRLAIGKVLLIGAVSGLIAGMSGLIIVMTILGNLISAIAYALVTVVPMSVAELLAGSICGMIGWFIGHPLQQEKRLIMLGGAIGGFLASSS